MMLFKILNDAKVPEHCRRHEWRIHTTAKNVFVTKTRAGAKAFINHQSEDEIIAQSILMSPGGMPGFNFLAIQLHFREK